MPVTLSQPGRRQKYLILVLILVILAALIIFLIKFLIKPKTEKPEKMIIERPPLIEIDFQVLENPILKNLEIFEEIPALEEGFGRENPFQPY